MNTQKQVLDACCGGRMFWFQPEYHLALFQDVRNESHVLCDDRYFVVNPDTIVDFRDMPHPDESFNLVVFDPPQLVRVSDNAWMFKKYGRLEKTWKEDIASGFSECWRVLRPGGTLIFKWSEVQIKLNEVLACFPVRPLFGHTTSRNMNTHWMVFYKPAAPEGE